MGEKVINIGWYTRDGYIDLYPLISKQLKFDGYPIASFYACNCTRDTEHLYQNYGIKNSWVLSKYISEKDWDISDRAIRTLEKKYTSRAIVECLWGDKFELKLSESELRKNLVSHFDFWESFVKNLEIKVLVTEHTSILSTCVAWMVCNKYNVSFFSYGTVPIMGGRVGIITDWKARYEGLDEIVKNNHSITNRDTLELTKKFLKQIKHSGVKKNETAVFEMANSNKISVIPKISFSYNDIKERIIRRKKRTEYYLYRKTYNEEIRHRLRLRFKRFRQSLLLKKAIFHKRNIDYNPNEDRFYLFPLHMSGEWGNYSFIGLHNANLPSLAREIADCLPVGSYLYVKEHTSGFGVRKKDFYLEIKSHPNIRMINPYEDTIDLIKHCKAVITLGSTVGFEAFLLKKPVFYYGEPWYRYFPGFSKVGSPGELALCMQNTLEFSVATDSQIQKCVAAMYDVSFEGYLYKLSMLKDPENIIRYSKALAEYFKFEKHEGLAQKPGKK